MWDWALFFGTIGFFLTLDVPVHPGAADDFDLRDAHAGTETVAGSPDCGACSPLRRPETESWPKWRRSTASWPSSRTRTISWPQPSARHAEGYRRIDAYTPFPIEGLAEAIGFHYNRLPLLVLIGGLAGAAGGFGLQYWVAAITYPINVGGRPFNSWPSFIPVTFEMTILLAALTAVLGLLALNGLPMPYHPVFNVPRFALATRDRFFLCIEATDPRFDREGTRRFLEGLGPREVSEVVP